MVVNNIRFIPMCKITGPITPITSNYLRIETEDGICFAKRIEIHTQGIYGDFIKKSEEQTQTEEHGIAQP